MQIEGCCVPKAGRCLHDGTAYGCSDAGPGIYRVLGQQFKHCTLAVPCCGPYILMIFLCILRQKIESIVRRGGGVADQDCPTSIEDMSYWVVTSRKRTETESLERVADLTAHVDAQSAMGVLTGSDARLERLTGMSLDPSQAPATQDILKFVKDGAGITQPAGVLCFVASAVFRFVLNIGSPYYLQDSLQQCRPRQRQRTR